MFMTRQLIFMTLIPRSRKNDKKKIYHENQYGYVQKWIMAVLQTFPLFFRLTFLLCCLRLCLFMYSMFLICCCQTRSYWKCFSFKKILPLLLREFPRLSRGKLSTRFYREREIRVFRWVFFKFNFHRLKKSLPTFLC